MPFGARSGKINLGGFYSESTAKDFMSMYEKLVQESWDDAELRARIISEPEKVFSERGFDTSEMKEKGFTFKMVESDLTDHKTDSIRIPLPKKPDPSELTEDELIAIEGGVNTHGVTPPTKSTSCAGSAGSTGSASCPVSTASTAGTAGSSGDCSGL